MKSFLKNILVGILGWQVRRLRKKNDFKIIGVAGSIGKTSTKLAIAKVLEGGVRVRYQEGNYNDIVSVPLVIFGEQMPSLWNVPAWKWILLKNEWQILRRFPFDVVVVELGTDAPGQIIRFKKYLRLDFAVLTAIAPEHMEFFKTIRNVAEEEWAIRFFAEEVFANRDLCQILPENLNRNQVIFYGKDFDPDYKYKALSPVQLYAVSIAVRLAERFKISKEKIKRAVEELRPFAGRMQKLSGIKNSVIIDDTYNASPVAVKMALDALYAYPATQRVAILGMMNELGESSENEHRQIGKYCNPKFLDLVITIGRDANRFLAPEARHSGCEVYEAKDSIDAGVFAQGRIEEGAVILAKGSQNGVFAEEALKSLLAHSADFSKLVRQDREWMKKKIKLSR